MITINGINRTRSNLHWSQTSIFSIVNRETVNSPKKPTAFCLNTYIRIMWSRNKTRRYKPTHGLTWSSRDTSSFKLMQVTIECLQAKLGRLRRKNRSGINIAKYDILAKKHPGIPANNFSLNSQVPCHNAECK